MGAVPGERRVYGQHSVETKGEVDQNSSQQHHGQHGDRTVHTGNGADVVRAMGDRGVLGAVGVSVGLGARL